MKKISMKKWLACLLAVCMLPALCACSGTSGSKAKDPGKVLQAAAEKLDQAKSVSFDSEVLLTISSHGDDLAMGITTKGDVIREPLQAHGTIHMDMIFFDLDMEEYVVREDGALTAYTGYTQNGVTTEWSKSVLNPDDPDSVKNTTATYDVNSSFSTQFELVDELKEVGAEEIGDKQATRYDGVIHGTDLGKVLGQTEAEDTLDSLGIDLSQVDQDVPVSIWIYEDGLPAKYELDMTDLITQIIAQNDDAADVDAASMRVSTVITGVDTVSEIVVPQEALDAPAVSTDPVAD